MDLAGARVVIMGLGRFGGGIGATRYCAEQGADVVVTDAAGADSLTGALAGVADLVETGAVTLRLGGHNVSDFSTADLIIANPAVPTPWANRFLRSAEAAGVPIVSEIALLLDEMAQRGVPGERRRLIGVTGTFGKSTTAAMLRAGIEAGGVRAHLGGNIGGSLLGQLDRIGPDDAVVLELSSAMLHWLDRSPGVAVVTSFAPNHIDWHGSIDHYRDSKRRLLAFQRSGDAAVLADGLSDWTTLPGVERVRPVWPGEVDLAIPGAHNRANASCALAAAVAAGVDAHAAARGIAVFRGLPHRLELVCERDGVRYVNDSKSTTPDATQIAVEALDASRVRLLVGGADKGIDLSPIGGLAGRVASMHAFGATAVAIARNARGVVDVHDDLDAAYAAAASAASAGDVVLLSPGCASWDQFVNYEARGDRFRALACGRADASRD